MFVRQRVCWIQYLHTYICIYICKGLRFWIFEISSIPHRMPIYVCMLNGIYFGESLRCLLNFTETFWIKNVECLYVYWTNSFQKIASKIIAQWLRNANHWEVLVWFRLKWIYLEYFCSTASQTWIHVTPVNRFLLEFAKAKLFYYMNMIENVYIICARLKS